MALTENLIWENGKVLNQQLADYKVPTTQDAPKVETILVETDDPNGPFGAKGVGEAGLVPTAAGSICQTPSMTQWVVRIREPPITPEKILAALKKGRVPDER